jgi:hypothetical protein
MTEGDAVLVGGPADGAAFTAEDAGLVELEYDGMVHRYILTTQKHDGRTLYNYDGVVNPHGAQDGAEHAADRLASPLARDQEETE